MVWSSLTPLYSTNMLLFYLSLLASSLIVPIFMKYWLPFLDSTSVSSNQWLQQISTSFSSFLLPFIYFFDCILWFIFSQLTHFFLKNQYNRLYQNIYAFPLLANPILHHSYICQFAFWLENFKLPIARWAIFAYCAINALLLPTWMRCYFLANIKALLFSHW